MNHLLLAPETVDSIDEIKIKAEVTNIGFEDIKVLKYGTVLDGSNPTRSFVVSKDSIDASFTGIKVRLKMLFLVTPQFKIYKISLDMNQLGDEAFTIIPAGSTVLVEHESELE